MAIHHTRLSILPHASDYIPPRPGRMVVPWAMHPKALRGQAFRPVDLTPWMPAAQNQDRIGECSACGTVCGVVTSLAKAGHAFPGYPAAEPVYRMTRATERAAAGDDPATTPLCDSGASPDDAKQVVSTFGIMTSEDECGEIGPGPALSAYEDAHVNDEPTASDLENMIAVPPVHAFDIVSTGQQRIDDARSALTAGFAFGYDVYAADARFQNYVGGIMPPPPEGAQNDHWQFCPAVYMDATGSLVFPTGNSWGPEWGQPWGNNRGGMWLATEAHILAATCIVVYAVAP